LIYGRVVLLYGLKAIWNEVNPTPYPLPREGDFGRYPLSEGFAPGYQPPFGRCIAFQAKKFHGSVYSLPG